MVNDVAEQAPSGEPEGGALARKAHATIAKVTDDIGRRYAFNTAIAAVMELVNDLSKDRSGPDARFAAETAVSLIQPYAPHITEELWERLGHERLWEAPWPVADPAMLEVDTVEVVVQVNGKIRDRLHVSPDIDGGRARRAGSRVRARAGAPGRRRRGQDGRRPGQARQLRDVGRARSPGLTRGSDPRV